MISRDGGIYYEINPDHLLVNSIVENYPDLQLPIENLLKQISLSLPLNSLYIDLTNDEKLANDNDFVVNDIIMLAKTIVMANQGEDERNKIFEALKLTEPFCSYIEELDIAKERGEFNDE